MQDRWIATAISAWSDDLGTGLVSVGPVVIEVQLDGHGHQKDLTLGTSCNPASRSPEPCRTAG